MQPYKCKRVLVKVGSQKVGVVEGFVNEAIKNGGVEANYKNNAGRHAKGSIFMPFSIRRWMYIDPNKKRLLYDLWKNKTHFMLHFGLHDGDYENFDSQTEFVLSDCVAYRWRPITGSPNDIVAEEIVGDARQILWLNACPCDEDEEMLTNGDFETGNLNGWTTDDTVISAIEHSGSYSAKISNTGYISQSVILPVRCLEEFSLYMNTGPCGFGANYKITVTYSDATTVTTTGVIGGSWTKVDLSNWTSLDADKTISSIKIERTGGGEALLVDDVTIKCNGGNYEE